jgi:hypothetical protein
MNRSERKNQSLEANIQLKQTRMLKAGSSKPKAGKKLKRWKKALAASQPKEG